MAEYFLAKDAFLCESGGHAVFLDLKRDRYVALSPADATQLAVLMPSLATLASFTSDKQRNAGARGSEPLELQQMLEREGLVVRERSRGKAAEIAITEDPQDTAWNESASWTPLRLRDVRKFLTAWASANLMLKVLPLKVIVRRVKSRKQRARPHSTISSMDETRMLMKTFFSVQPISFFSETACIRRSLALVEFLAGYEIYPTWVFGVRIQPFAARCWVQDGKTVLNDSVEQVRMFTPLMAV